MSDIVERLRSATDYDCKDDAADEIERLRIACSQWELTVNRRDAEIERLQVDLGREVSAGREHVNRLNAEIERLRAMLW